jgi:hypothetical protein
MSPSSVVTYCEDHSMSIWFITKALDKVIHINTSRSTGFSDTIYIIHFDPQFLISMLYVYKYGKMTYAVIVTNFRLVFIGVTSRTFNSCLHNM